MTEGFSLPARRPYAAGHTATVSQMNLVVVRRSARARRWRLEVPWGEPAQLTVPRAMSRAEVERVIAEHQSWITSQRRRQVPQLVPGLFILRRRHSVSS